MIFDMTKRKGGNDSKVTQIDVVAVTTGAAISVPYVLPDNCAMFITIDEIPEPDASLYWGLVWAFNYIKTPRDMGIGNGTSILRPNGSYGTDAGWCTYANNIINIGVGNYGKCKAGSTYHIVIADMGVA